MENWSRIKEGLEAAGKTDCFYYTRACKIVNGGEDPLDIISDTTVEKEEGD